MRFVKARWRLLVSGLFGLAVIAFLPFDLLHVTRLLIGWDAGIALYLLLVLTMVLGSDAASVCREAAMQDEGRYAVPILHRNRRHGEPGRHRRLAAFDPRLRSRSRPISRCCFSPRCCRGRSSTRSSPCTTHTSSMPEHRGNGGGLHFPGDAKPNYWDFIYFAFTVGTSTAVSDVAVTSRAIRKTVTIHALVAFIFNVTMIALTVSIAGDAISGK